MKKTISIFLLLNTINLLASDYCKKDYMSNLEYATKKIDLKDKKKIKPYGVFMGKKNINRQINKTTYNYLKFNFFDEDVANRWVELTKSYLKSEKEHLGIDLDISEKTLFFNTLKEIGLMARYKKEEIKKFYLELFKKYDFFSENFQRPTIYKYMIMKNLGVASDKDLNLYLKKILSEGEVYDDHHSVNNYFSRRYYYAFYTNEDIVSIYKKFDGEMKSKKSILMKIANVCKDRKSIGFERETTLNKNELLDLFYYSFIYPDIRPVIENYFVATGLVKLWSFWNYEYFEKRENYFLASHYFELFYLKSKESFRKILYFDYINIRVKELSWLMAHGKPYQAYEKSLGIIFELSSIKEGIPDKYFPLVNKTKEAINDSSEVILEHIKDVGDVQTYNRILKNRDSTVLHILKRKY